MTSKHEESSGGYEKPQIRVMNEAEILNVFQITSAALSWWHV